MTCPYLDYRESGDGREFDTARGFCTVTSTFVQPMRADVCNDRYDLHHAEHCEIYLAQEEASGPSDDANPGVSEP